MSKHVHMLYMTKQKYIYVHVKQHTASFSFLKAVSSFTISRSFSNASVLYTYFPRMTSSHHSPTAVRSSLVTERVTGLARLPGGCRMTHTTCRVPSTPVYSVLSNPNTTSVEMYCHMYRVWFHFQLCMKTHRLQNTY